MIFFDANVVIEAMLIRANAQKATYAIQKAGDQAAISSLTGHLVVYFGKKERIDVSTALGYVVDFTMLPLEQADFDWAYTNMRDDDFEDALQLAVAIRNGCDIFMTFDKKLHDTYKSLPQLKIKLVK